MENQMSFVRVLSLKQIALRRVVINLWTEPDILASIEKLSDVSGKDYSERWLETVGSKVANKMLKLVIPESLSRELLHFVKPIGLQIQRWKKFHERYLEMPDSGVIWEKYIRGLCVELDAPTLAKLCWTTAGSVDYRKTAEELARYEMIDVVKRYKLACLYCLHDCIPVLWEKLPEKVKRNFCTQGRALHIEELNLQFCWPYILKEEHTKLDYLTTKCLGYPTSFHQHAFKKSACQGNIAATEYFFQKLTNKEKEVSFLRITALTAVSVRSSMGNSYTPNLFPSDKICEVLCYLLSLMNYEEQIQIIKLLPAQILMCFLDWPWQDIFLKIAGMIWSFLSAEQYDSLLLKMRDYFRYYKYSYPKFFHEFFTHSPVNFRKKFVDRECRFGFFLPIFFDIQDSEAVEVIFSNVDAADRERLVSSNHALFYKYILIGEYNMVKVCLRVATLSNEDTEKLKVTFMEYVRSIDGGEKQCTVYTRFVRMLDEIFAKAQRKRSLDDETRNEAPVNKKALLTQWHPIIFSMSFNIAQNNVQYWVLLG